MTVPHPGALRLSPPPADGKVLSATRPQRIVALAHDARELYRARHFIRGMEMAGHQVVLVWLEGDLGTSALRQKRLRITPGLARTPRGAVRQVLTTPIGHWRGDRSQLLGAVRLDPRVQRALRVADALVPFGDAAREVAEEVARSRCAVVPRSDLTGWAPLARTWKQLAARAAAGRLTASLARNLASKLPILGDTVPERAQGDLTELLAELVRAGEHEAAGQLVPYLRLSSDDLAESARRRALAATIRTSLTGTEDSDLRGSAAALITQVDRVLAEGEVSRAASLLTLALGLLFHPEVHSDNLSTPLVEEPENFLSAWRDSSVARLLSRPSADGSARVRGHARPEPGQRPHVVVAPGSYPRFAAQPIDALRASSDVDVVDLTRQAHLRGLGVREELVAARLRQALGEPVVVDDQLVGELAGAHALFVDWADRGAVAALMTVPEGVRVTLRIHSMDALSAWVHLLDWSRVDEVVFVSNHVRDVVLRMLGQRLAGTRVHVITNSVDLQRVTLDKSEGWLRRILMIGWAQRVKDPLWALDVLARLRADDQQWRLVLVGPDFSSVNPRSRKQVAGEFSRRLTQPDVKDAVEFAGETYDLAPHLAASGFVLSSSRRESCPVGVLEAAASGSVPVVRNWPVFASLDAARRLFPQDWVVDTVDEAAARIAEHADAEAWRRASDRTRTETAGRFLSASPVALLVSVVLGDDEVEGAPGHSRPGG